MSNQHDVNTDRERLEQVCFEEYCFNCQLLICSRAYLDQERALRGHLLNNSFIHVLSKPECYFVLTILIMIR
jgi:hypothetical protein